MDIAHVEQVHRNEGTFLAIHWIATTDSDSKRYQYQSWEVIGVTAQDDQGNVYPQRAVSLPPGRYGWSKEVRDLCEVLRNEAKIKGRDLTFHRDGQSLTSERAIQDAAVFDVPVRAATGMTVRFRGDRLGLGSDFVFNVPRELWTTKR